VVRRHESLRTTFVATQGQPAQVIAPDAHLDMPLIDLSDLSEAEQTQRLAEIALQEAHHSFDLSTGPLLRAVLARLNCNGDAHALFLSMHHIISDGWSMNVLLHEVSVIYAAYVAGQPSPLPPLSVQYADFALWQRKRLQGDVLQHQLDYWTTQLAGSPALLMLPADRPRSEVQTFNGRRHALHMPPTLTEQLRALARNEDSSLFVVVLAAFQLLLHRYTGQDDVVVGTPIAGRDHAELEPLIGLFINTLALRARFDPMLNFRALLRQVRERVLGALSHQDMPFEKLVDALQLERDLSYSPLFQVMFTLDEARANTPLPSGAFTFQPLSVDSGTVQFDLTLELTDTPDGLFGSFNYNTDLFDAETIERMVRTFDVLLRELLACPDAPLPNLRGQDAAEARQLEAWNAPVAGAVSEVERDIATWFDEVAVAHASRVAVRADDVVLTYAELDARAKDWAQHLRTAIGHTACPACHDHIVAVILPRGADVVVAQVACLKAGAAYLSIDAGLPAERIAFMLADAGVRAIITNDALAHGLNVNDDIAVLTAELLHAIDVGEPQNPQDRSEWSASSASLAGAGAPAGANSASRLAYLIYTSGSTGMPKGVGVTHAGLANLVRWHQRAFGLSANDVTTQVAGLGFDASVWEIWSALLSGAAVCVPPDEVRTDAQALIGWLQGEGVTVSFLPTPLAEVALEEAWPSDSRLRYLLTGGDRLRRGASAGLPFELINNYGPTENAVVATSGVVSNDASERVPTIGRVIDGVQGYVLDGWMQPVPIGAIGELYLGGASLARGYVNRAELTAERFVPNPYGGAGSRMYRTGDLVRWTGEGELAFIGRIDQQVKVRGYRIELGEIEAALLAQAGVREAVVVARASGASTMLVAYIAADTTDDAFIDQLKQHLSARLPDYMVPSVFMLLDALPLTPNGKLDRKALPVLDGEQSGTLYVAPHTETAIKLAAIWTDVLGLERVGIHDNFFDLGGHSLLATRIVSRVREAFSLDLQLRMFFDTLTVASMSQLIDAMRWAQATQPNTNGSANTNAHSEEGEI